jgi:hypothetical protein
VLSEQKETIMRRIWLVLVSVVVVALPVMLAGSANAQPVRPVAAHQAVSPHGVVKDTARLGGAPPPCGLGTYPVYNIGQTWWAQDGGAGKIIVIDNGSCYQQIYGQSAGGYEWWQFEDTASRCINIGSDDYAYSNSCPEHDSTEQFAIISDGSGGFYLWNRHTSDYLAACGAPDGLVYVTSNLSQVCAANGGGTTDWNNAG